MPFLRLVYKYISKHKVAMGYGVNHISRFGIHPLTILIDRGFRWTHLLEEMLQLYINISKVSNVTIDSYEIEVAIERCSGKEKCLQMLRDYQKQH